LYLYFPTQEIELYYTCLMPETYMVTVVPPAMRWTARATRSGLDLYVLYVTS